MQFISQSYFDSLHSDYKSSTHILTTSKTWAIESVPYTILPWEYVQSSTWVLCTDDIYITISFDKKENWNNWYIENSNYVKVCIDESNKLYQFVTCLYKKWMPTWYENRLNKKLRASQNKTQEQAIKKLIAYLSDVQSYYKS